MYRRWKEYPEAEVAVRHKLDELFEEGSKELYPEKVRVTVGMASCGRSAGADDVYQTMVEFVGGKKGEVALSQVGCFGLCWAEPLVSVLIPGMPRAIYGMVDKERSKAIIEAALMGTLSIDTQSFFLGFIYDDEHSLFGVMRNLCKSESREHDIFGEPYLNAQKRILMGNCGLINPTALAEYVAVGGYRALFQALYMQDDEAILEEIEKSRLRGRGGAGFLTGLKWRKVAQSRVGKRYFIVNADEGDPGAYMDRALIESDPHRILEGLAIGACVLDIQEVYIFVRSEYGLAIEILQQAIAEAEATGILGDNVLGTGRKLFIRIVKSAGSFISGEETAMISALEGFACSPRPRPPYPSECGLGGCPTVINNIETLANVPAILNRGAQWFRSFGGEDSAGTKIFSLTGAIPRSGLIEVPLGIKLSTLINSIAGAADAKAMQIGGPSGAILPLSEVNAVDTLMSFEGLAAAGGMMGSGGLVVLGKNQCIVDTVLYCVTFAEHESCGKCTPCRDGLAACKDILEKIAAGKGSPSSLDALLAIAFYIKESSFCSFGTMVPNLILNGVEFFRNEFEEHINGCCRAHVCTQLIHFEIDKKKCHGERCCLQTCPGNAIKGSFGKPGYIVERLCTKCWMCTTRCPYGAIHSATGDFCEN